MKETHWTMAGGNVSSVVKTIQEMSQGIITDVGSIHMSMFSPKEEGKGKVKCHAPKGKCVDSIGLEGACLVMHQVLKHLHRPKPLTGALGESCGVPSRTNVIDGKLAGTST